MTREEAKREMLFAKREVMADSYIDKAYDMAIKALEQPEIIRCRECEYHRKENSGVYYCYRKEYGYGWGLNDFCSDAKRREEGGE